MIKITEKDRYEGYLSLRKCVRQYYPNSQENKKYHQYLQTLNITL